MEEWSEAASNFDLSAHHFDYWLDKSDFAERDNLKQFRDAAKARLNHCVFRGGGGVKYFRGRWATKSTLCASFKNFPGYPQSYHEERE